MLLPNRPSEIRVKFIIGLKPMINPSVNGKLSISIEAEYTTTLKS
jgi:hypothetical protein